MQECSGTQSKRRVNGLQRAPVSQGKAAKAHYLSCKSIVEERDNW